MLLRRTWQIYKYSILTFLGIEIVPIFIATALTVASFFLPKSPWTSTFFFSGYILAIAVAELWAILALVYVIKQREVEVGTRIALKVSWAKISFYLPSALFVSFIIIGCFFLFNVITPSFLNSIWFGLAVWILVSKKGIDFIFRAKHLTKGYGRKVLGKSALIILIGVSVSLPIYVLFDILISSPTIFIKIFYGLAASFFFIPFVIVYLNLGYEDLKRFKENVPFVPSQRKTRIKFTLIVILVSISLAFVGQVGREYLWKSYVYTQINRRDTIRENHRIIIQAALKNYDPKSHTFPETLDQLIPNYIETVPKDPQTNLPYQYEAILKGKDYELCIDFELKPDRCKARLPQFSYLGLPKAGITPESPFYFLDTLGEKIVMFFTFSAEKKAKVALNFAKEKLAEVELTAEKIKLKALEKASQKYEEYLNLVNLNLGKVKQEEKREFLSSLICEKTLRYQQTLLKIFKESSKYLQIQIRIGKAARLSKEIFEQVFEKVPGSKKERLHWEIEGLRTEGFQQEGFFSPKKIEEEKLEPEELLTEKIKTSATERIKTSVEDSSLCEKIESLDKKSLCYSDVAIAIGDFSICEKTDLRFPDTVINCYSYFAQELKDISICDRIEENCIKERCRAGLVYMFKDVSICDEMECKEVKDTCYQQLALAVFDSTLCEKISDLELRDLCYKEVEESKPKPE